MSAFRRLVQDAATQAGGGDRVQKQADFPARNSGGQPLSEARRQTAELLPRFNDAAERRQAKEAGFSALLRALAQLSGGFAQRTRYPFFLV